MKKPNGERKDETKILLGRYIARLTHEFHGHSRYAQHLSHSVEHGAVFLVQCHDTSRQV